MPEEPQPIPRQSVAHPVPERHMAGTKRGADLAGTGAAGSLVVGLLVAGLLTLGLASCGDELQEIVDQLAFVAELDVADNLPAITIASEDSTNIEVLRCELTWDGPQEQHLGCLLEKRRYPSGRTFRIAVGLAEYDAADSLVGYVTNINTRTFYYGTADSGVVDCGLSSELPQVDLTVEVEPASNISPYRAAVGISEVLIQLSDQTDYGCFFDAEDQVTQEWLIFAAPDASQCRPGDLGSSFIPDVGGDYVFGWRLRNEAGQDTDTLTLTAVDDHHIDYLSGVVVPEGPGMCWFEGGFWYVDWGGLRRVRLNGSGVEFRPFPISISDASGVCCRGDAVWVTGGDGLGGVHIHEIDAAGQLDDTIPLTALGIARPVLACDSTLVWVGEWQGRGIYALGEEEEIIGFFEIPDTMGVITDLAYDGQSLWISASEPAGGGAGLIRMTADGEPLEIWPLEFVNPMGVTFDGTGLVVLDGDDGDITYGHRVMKLDIP